MFSFTHITVLSNTNMLRTRVLASGFLSGKLTNGNTEGTRFDSDGAMNKFMQNLYNHEPLHNALKQLEETTRALGITTIDAALRWAYYHSSLEKGDGIILGASSIRQPSQISRASVRVLCHESVSIHSSIFGRHWSR